MRYSLKELSAKIKEIAAKYEKVESDLAPETLRYVRSQIAVGLEQFMSGDERHQFLSMLTDMSSTKSMPASMLRSLHRWLYPNCRGGMDKPEYVDKHYVVCEFAEEEIKKILQLMRAGFIM